MKIDLHLHTPSSKINGDSIHWESTLSSIKKMHSRLIGAFSFTDHNFFSYKTFKEAREICGNTIKVFPGVEINIKKENGVIAHIIVIFDYGIHENKIKDLENICKKNLKKQGVNINKVYEIFNDYETIIIPHVGKSDYFKPDELDFDHDAIETSSLKNENYIKWLRIKNNKSVVAFSDTHIWKKYPQLNQLETVIEFDGSFADLKLKLRNNKKWIRTI